MKFLKRLFKIGEAEANKALDNIENPIHMTEQGIRDLRDDLDKALEALAKVKSLAIRSRNDHENYTEKAKDYESKAILLLKKAENKEISSEEADRLATEALKKKQELEGQASRSKQEQEKNEVHAENLHANIEKMKSTISKWENELRTLKARHEVSQATKNINKQIAAIDSEGTVAMLERMKEKIAAQEALSEAYSEISLESKSIDDELNDALGGETEAAKSDLEKLKAKIKGSKK